MNIDETKRQSIKKKAWDKSPQAESFANIKNMHGYLKKWMEQNASENLTRKEKSFLRSHIKDLYKGKEILTTNAGKKESYYGTLKCTAFPFRLIPPLKNPKGIFKLFRKKTTPYLGDKKNITIFRKCADWVILTASIAWVFYSPMILDRLTNNKIDETPVLDQISQDIDRLPNKDIERDENGLIIERPVKDEELVAAHSKLEKKLLKDCRYFGFNFEKIDSIDSIYEHEMLHENHGKQSLIEVIVDVEGQKYALQYTNFSKDLKINNSINDTNTLASSIIYLQSCYLSNFVVMDEKQEEILQAAENALGEKVDFVSPVFDYREASGQVQKRIAVYSNNECKLYSVPERDLYEDELTTEDALILFLNGKNEFFTKVETPIRPEFESFLNASKIANNMKNIEDETDALDYIDDLAKSIVSDELSRD